MALVEKTDLLCYNPGGQMTLPLLLQKPGQSAGTALQGSADFRLTDGDEQVRLVLAGESAFPRQPVTKVHSERRPVSFVRQHWWAGTGLHLGQRYCQDIIRRRLGKRAKHVTISGAGDGDYFGRPAKTQDISGAGSITSRGDK